MLKRHWLAALIFLALTLILTNPLILHAWNAVEDKQDALLNTWIVAWVGHAAITNPLNLYNANIFYPYPGTLAFSEILVPQGLLTLPITLATNNSIFGYNLVLLAMFWLDAFTMYLFIFDLAQRAQAGWIAGAIFAFNPFNLGNLAQLQLVSLGWLPLALLYLRRLLRPQSNTPILDCLLFALFFILQALSSIYYALLASFAIVIYLVWWGISQRARLLTLIQSTLFHRSISFHPLTLYAFRLTFSALLIAIVLIPFLLPYFQVQRELGFQRRVEESEPFSASLKQFSEVSPQNLLYGNFLAPNPVKFVGGYPLDNLFPGIVALGLATIGLLRIKRREKWFLAALLLVAFVLALGPRLYLTSGQATGIVLPYRWLYEIFSPMRALRAPVRFEALILFALAALAGFGAMVLIPRRQPKRRSSMSLGIIAVIALEYISFPAARITLLPVASEIPPVYQWLAQQPPGVVLELPMMGPDAQGQLDISKQYFSTYHWHPTADGYSGFVPPRRGEIAYEMQTISSPRAISLMQALDVKYLIVHFAELNSESPLGDWLAHNQNLVLQKNFGSDSVYRVLPPRDNASAYLRAQLYLPNPVRAGAPYTAFYVLFTSGKIPFAVKPTDRLQLVARWSDGRVEHLSVPLPLVTSTASVIPLTLDVPTHGGTFSVQIESPYKDPKGRDPSGDVQVGTDAAQEIVIPVQLTGAQSLNATDYARGATVPVYVEWRVLNKVDAYYSVSVRVVDGEEKKVVAVDRQPRVPTLLWKPDRNEWDSFDMKLPDDIAPGKYRVELLMYQGNDDTSVLLLDQEFRPQEKFVLGEFEVK